ncbi:hypothetical protein ZWY2020_014991 [Hordeum vulgare]|nr:hypothetical protein ZWY2020_014991 [Hordeum vulgare]
MRREVEATAAICGRATPSAGRSGSKQRNENTFSARAVPDENGKRQLRILMKPRHSQKKSRWSRKGGEGDGLD